VTASQPEAAGRIGALMAHEALPPNVTTPVTAWGSLAISHPFTMGIARRSVPQHFWNTPQFRRANNVITAAWAASFTVTALATGAVDLVASHASLATTLIQVAGFVVPAIFTVRYQESRRRVAAQTLQAGRLRPGEPNHVGAHVPHWPPGSGHP
jgi:hypothetical protein